MRRRRHLRVWLWLGAALTLGILVIGGITRSTQSGLSIVEWSPLLGVIPPLNEAQWQDAFALYRQYPEYRQLRPDMTLAEYRTIFFWEYLHRMLARTIGLVFLVPFVAFWIRGYLRPKLTRRLLLLLGLGALQGAMGWFMVASGLVDRPSVAHERLAAHLVIAFVIFGTCLWLAADLGTDPARADVPPARHTRLHQALLLFGVLLGVQVVYGAFVAGLDAGQAFNTYPLMAGGWLPPAAWRLAPPLRNLIDNIATVQWIHRWIPLLLAVVATGLVVDVNTSSFPRADRLWSVVLLAGVAVQATLGILTLVNVVPIGLAVPHQATAMLLFGVWLLWFHRVRLTSGVRPASPPS